MILRHLETIRNREHYKYPDVKIKTRLLSGGSYPCIEEKYIGPKDQLVAFMRAVGLKSNFDKDIKLEQPTNESKSIKECREDTILTIKNSIKDNLVLDNYMGTGKSNYNDYQIELYHDSDNYGNYPWWYVISKDGSILTKKCYGDDLSNVLYSVAQFIYNTESKPLFDESLNNEEIKFQVTADLTGMDDVYSEHTNLKDAIESAKIAQQSFMNVKIKDLRDNSTWLDIADAEADLTDGLVEESLNEDNEPDKYRGSLKEELKEIDRKYFKTLETDGTGMYFVLSDNNFVSKFYADSDEEAIKRFRADTITEDYMPDDDDYDRIDRNGSDEERLLAAITYQYGVGMDKAREYEKELSDQEKTRALKYYDLRMFPPEIRLQKMDESLNEDVTFSNFVLDGKGKIHSTLDLLKGYTFTTDTTFICPHDEHSLVEIYSDTDGQHVLQCTHCQTQYAYEDNNLESFQEI